jgi:hypothetical protein
MSDGLLVDSIRNANRMLKKTVSEAAASEEANRRLFSPAHPSPI